MTTWLRHLDARDRALLVRVSLGPDCAAMSRGFWHLITHLGGARGSIGLCLLALLIPGVTIAIAWRTLLLLGISHAAVQVVKRLVGRPRPPQLHGVALIDIPDRFSFPSGHACAAMAVAVGFSAAFPALSLPLLALAWIVGVSRVVLGVHYPGDVLVGQAIALLTAAPLLA